MRGTRCWSNSGSRVHKAADSVIPPTGRKLKARMAATFEFAPGSDLILCERPYFDQLGMLRSIGIEL